jgi:hypothetical protein
MNRKVSSPPRSFAPCLQTQGRAAHGYHRHYRRAGRLLYAGTSHGGEGALINHLHLAREQTAEWLSGNICRYGAIAQSILEAAQEYQN